MVVDWTVESLHAIQPARCRSGKSKSVFSDERMREGAVPRDLSKYDDMLTGSRLYLQYTAGIMADVMIHAVLWDHSPAVL